MNVRIFAAIAAGVVLVAAAAGQDFQTLYLGPAEPTLEPGAEFGSSVALVDPPALPAMLLIGGPNRGADRGRVVLADAETGANSVVYTGAEDGVRMGEVVAAGGSVNGDAYPDFAIAAPQENYLSFSPPGL